MRRKKYFEKLLKDIPVSKIQFITDETVRISVFGGFWIISYLSEPEKVVDRPLISTSFVGLITIDSVAEFISADALAERLMDQIA